MPQTKEARAAISLNQRRRREAAELEQRAASLTFTIATLDEERTRLLVRATVLRELAAK